MSTDPALHPHAAARSVNRRPGPAATRAAHPRPARATVARPRLVAALAEREAALAVIVAPAGWGKSTVVAQWRKADPRPFAVIALTAAHDDETELTAAIDGALHELRSSARRVVLVLDGLEKLHSSAARAAVAGHADRLPDEVMLVLASRSDPDLPLGRRRADDDVVELRADQLTMTLEEAGQLLRAAAPGASDRLVERLHSLTGGWPAALRLAARAAREKGSGAVFSGVDSAVGDYMHEEVLAAVRPDDRAFLRRAAVIEPLTGSACDAALGTRGSAARLRRLAADGLPLVPVDPAGAEFRLTPLLAESLRAELRDLEPHVERRLHRRLSSWYEREDDVANAIEHAVGARDAARAGALLAPRAASYVADGRLARVQAWVDAMGDEEIARHPGLALTTALVHLVSGRCDAAERWAVVAESGDAAGRVGPPLVRALCGGQGVDRMASQARASLAAAPPHGPWRSLGCLAEASALLLAGRADDADAVLGDGARAAVFDAPLARSLCLAEMGVLALARGDAEEAAALTGRARAAIERGGADAHGMAALTFAADAAAQAQRGRLDAARAALQLAVRRLADLPDPPPWYGALTLVLMARPALKLGDADQARQLLARASRLSRRIAGATALQGWIDDGWALADDFAADHAAPGGTFTMAELRVLRLLPSHLSLPEIAGRLRVSPNTIKSQAHAIYRKLGARSRSEAVARAAAIGLVEARLSRTG